MANGQRVRNTHPDGGLRGLGISPVASRRSLARRALGAACIRIAVYGCAGRLNRASVGAVSIIRPRYSTMTRSAITSTTDNHDAHPRHGSEAGVVEARS